MKVIYPLEAPGLLIEEVTRMALRRRLEQAKVKMTRGTSLKSISGNSVTVTNPGGEAERVIEGIDTIILLWRGGRQRSVPGAQG